MNKIVTLLILSLLVIVNLLRLYNIDDVPAGYHVDEYSAAVTTRCLGLEGTSAWGLKSGAFFSVAYGSPRPATYIWPGALIGRVFGFTVPVLRIMSALGVIFGILGIFLFLIYI